MELRELPRAVMGAPRCSG